MLEEAARFRARGYRITFVCNPGAALAQRAAAQGIPTLPLPMRQSYDLPSMLRFWALLGRHQVDILHTHSSKDHWICGPAARRRGIPIVRTRHIGTPVKTNPFSSFVYTALSDRLLTSSLDTKKDLLRIPTLNPAHVVEIPAGIDLERFSPSVSGKAIIAEFGLHEADPIIGYVSRLERGKGFRYLMEAAPALLKRWPRAKFVFVGDGPPWDRHTADELLDRLQLKPHAILTGFRSDIPELLATMHCLVFPSFKVEGTPQVLLQAMAMGIPIVATRIGGIPDLIEDGTMGRLVEPENPVALADAVQRVLEHREESLAAAQRARQRVLQNFSLDQAIERTASIYRGLV
ncbi:glycosyltransferase family 4 protein [Nitrospirales bacterium NOB]|nr:N-acetyl-alpha-D-glucosaminyl L-malate synthase [Nitrospirota bacterium]MDL1889548.1 glycosyltransferase family 4 protein [Nitrospirales bacterium NOB]